MKKRKKSIKQPTVNLAELLIGGLIDLIVAIVSAWIIQKLM